MDWEFSDEKIRLNNEFRRIASLPRRIFSESELEFWAKELTEILKLPWGKQHLRPLQAAALIELGIVGGLFAPLPVGYGKTLIAFLASKVLDCKRPLLLIPSYLEEKTRRDFRFYSRNWKIDHIRIMTYKWLGTEQANDALEKFQPDFFIADECQWLKNPDAAVTARVGRYFDDYPTVRMLAMSGSTTKRSILDYAHILEWCLGPKQMPLPNKYSDLTIWSDALDGRKNQLQRAHPGALLKLCNPEEYKIAKHNKLKAARSIYKRRIVETPGIIATDNSFNAVPMILRPVYAPKSDVIDAAFKHLRENWETPDGWSLADGFSVYRHAREMALGFYYVWDPRPPDDWIVARKKWYQWVRKQLGLRSNNGKTIDSKGQLTKFIKMGLYERPTCLDTWLDIKDSFIPNTIPRWLDDSIINLCTEWLRNNNGIVWTEHQAFGSRLSDNSNIPYYSKQGRNMEGGLIENHPEGLPMICSINSNKEGRNLQAWNKNFVTSSPPNALQWEQFSGRTHRNGQQKEVTFDIAWFCIEQAAAYWQSMLDARYTTDTIVPNKLVYVDTSQMPDIDDILDTSEQESYRWKKFSISDIK